jgi:2TM domain
MSHQSQPAPEGKDPVLWEIAQKRASFRGHLVSYLIVISFLWAIWFWSGNNYGNGYNHYPWPIWPMLGWGIGLAFHYAGAYVFPKVNLVEKEYQKLKNKQQ